MTWDDILALDNTALNLAIEQHCLGHQWNQEFYDQVNRTMWVLRHPGLAPVFSSVPHRFTTESWHDCMALAWRYRISLRPWLKDNGELGYWFVEQQERLEMGLEITVSTEGEARRAICQCALWRALQESTDA